jgi:hypothetical protein
MLVPVADLNGQPRAGAVYLAQIRHDLKRSDTRPTINCVRMLSILTFLASQAGRSCFQSGAPCEEVGHGRCH